jgi:hypothetical protein
MDMLSIYTKALAFSDPNATNNPQLRSFDWSRQSTGIPVNNPASQNYSIPPLGTVQVFNGVTTTAIDNTTVFNLAVVATGSSRYRLTYASGTAPAFRTDRNIGLASGVVTITPQVNQSIVLTHSTGAAFGSVLAGDVVFIPGVSTGDIGPFDPLNEGEWSVLYATSTALTLVRFPGAVYEMRAETVTLTAASQLQVYSAAGVQIDDVLQLRANFPASILRSYEIARVTATALEFYSPQILPSIAAITPGTTSLVIYSDAKQFLAIETNQEVDLFINGSATGLPVEPWVAGEATKVGTYHNTGTVYSLSVTNKTTQTATVRILSAE